jgi:hypothetical protein
MFERTTHGLADEPVGIFRVQNTAVKLVDAADSDDGPVEAVA